MYDELVKRLREAAISADSGNEISESLYRDILQAADAIKQLSNAGSAYGLGWTLGYDAGREESKPRWIPVTERLPEEPGEYMVYIKDPFYKREDEDFISFDGSYVTTAFYDKNTGLWNESEISCYCANLSCVNTEKTFHITHWMPLPSAPKEATDG